MATEQPQYAFAISDEIGAKTTRLCTGTQAPEQSTVTQGDLGTALTTLIDKNPNLKCIDISSINLPIDDLCPIARSLSKFLITSALSKGSIKRTIIVHEENVNSLRGKTRGLFYDLIKRSIGDTIELPDFEIKLRICDVFNADKITSSIIDHQESKDNKDILSRLTTSISTCDVSGATYCQRGQLATAAKQLIRRIR